MLKKHTITPKRHASVSASKIAAYVGAFLLLIAVVAIGYESPRQVSSQVANTDQYNSATVSSVNEDTTPSVDQVVATNVAAGLAERANLPVAKNVANMSVSLSAKNELAQTDSSAITKPQIVKPSSSNRSVITYIVKKGDTVPSLAAKFGITGNTIRWANDLGDTDALAPGKKLTILPTSGLLYTVKSGESIQEVASKFNSNPDRISLFNDLELTGIKEGQRLIVPEGEKPAAAPVIPAATNSFTSDLGGSILSNGFNSASAGNRYAYGNCTWYAFERRQQLGRPIGSFWGNANTWASSARASGYAVNYVPKSGAVLVDQAGYFGHVGVVERVKPNGDIVISEMNNYAYGGFGIVNQRTISAGQARNYLYIH